MSSSPSSSTPFKSNKPLQSAVIPKSPAPIATQTPERHSVRLRNRRFAGRQIMSSQSAPIGEARKSVQSEASNMPEKYALLGESFNCLDISIWQMRSKRSTTTFANLCPRIECLTGRRFSHRHLAQLKYLLPEAVEIERGDEIPEEELPEPFGHSKLVLKSDMNKVSTTSTLSAEGNHKHVDQSYSAEKHQPVMLSHFSTSFRRHFSQNVSIKKKVITDQIPLEKKRLASCVSSPNMPVPSLPATPSKGIDTSSIDDSTRKPASFQSTPVKVVSTSDAFMSITPALHPPKRCYMSPDSDYASSPDKLARRPTRIKSLKFEDTANNVKEEPDGIRDASEDEDDDPSKFFTEGLLQSIAEKERKAKEEQDPAISQAKRRRHMIACLPKLFNKIHFIFQSSKKSVSSKEELIHKITSSHLDIVDRKEVEQQLNLLFELVPEWISEKLASTGDSLLCINKMSNAETIRAWLEGAK